MTDDDDEASFVRSMCGKIASYLGLFAKGAFVLSLIGGVAYVEYYKG